MLAGVGALVVVLSILGALDIGNFYACYGPASSCGKGK